MGKCICKYKNRKTSCIISLDANNGLSRVVHMMVSALTSEGKPLKHDLTELPGLDRTFTNKFRATSIRRMMVKEHTAI